MYIKNHEKIFANICYLSVDRIYIVDYMCNHKVMNIRSLNVRGLKFTALPCGTCPTCRKREQLEWSFRLKTELLSLPKDEWYCVFFTQTYNEQNLPHFPRFLLNSDGEKKYSSYIPMCFSKDDIREFHTNLRYWLERECGAKDDKRYRWMTCAEYGENTQRCHYHTLLCIPRFVDAEKLFEKVKELWINKGFIFPKKFNGGYDKHGYFHKPFVVDSVEKAAGYCSKYISKDIKFEESIDRDCFKKCIVKKEFYVDKRNGQKKEREKKIYLSDYTCFHMQSRSLGLSFCESLSETQKLDFIKNGYYFDGDSFCNSVPRYMLKKFLFENYYVKVEEFGQKKRYCCTRPTHLFYQHKKEIFDLKVENIVKQMDDFDRNYLPQLEKFTNEIERANYNVVRNYFNQYSREEIAQKIVAYAGLNPAKVNQFLIPVSMWFRRYDVYQYVFNGVRIIEENTDDLKGVYELDEFCEVTNPQKEVDYLNKLYFTMIIIKGRIDLVPEKAKQIEERITSWVRDSFSSNEDY